MPLSFKDRRLSDVDSTRMANYGAGKVTQLYDIGTNNHLTPRDRLIVDLFPSVSIAKGP